MPSAERHRPATGPPVPRLTIGVPVYNGERYLGETLDSLLAQTFGDFIIIVGDNASTDGTQAIALRYAAQDPRVQYVRRERNVGIARNYNALFAAAETEYFRWHAADDLCAPGMLAACVAALDAEPTVALAYPRIMLVDQFGNEMSEYVEGLHLVDPRPSARFTALLANVRLCNAIFGVMRASMVRRTRMMGSFAGSDVPFQAELSLYGRFIEVPEILFFRRMHPAASSGVSRSDMRAMFNPGKRDSFEFLWWRQLREHVHSVLRAPIGAGERLRILLRLGRWFVGAREMYGAELLAGTRHLLRWRERPPAQAR